MKERLFTLFNKATNYLLIAMAIFVVARRLPGLLDEWRSTGTPAPGFSLSLLSSTDVFSLNTLQAPVVVVFWATWCGPCTIELNRINQMIIDKEIKAESVLAIDIAEDQPTVLKTVQERHYQFPVAIDSNAMVAQSYHVQGTPTVVFIDREHKINWLTAGMSPLLGWRLKWFLD
jgi:cytochrome c biogenesis protein CcmG, thiol:disulfide interchange protein DsbE